MKLLPENKELNRKYHELPVGKRLEFLLKGYSEVFDGKGQFAPMPLSPKNLTKKLTQKQRAKLNSTISNLNFLMTRFNMLHEPAYEEHVKELALLQFEYIFLTGDSEQTQNPELIAKFFEKRGKRELIKPVLERMGEHGVNYDFLIKKITDNKIYEEYVGNPKTLQFRTRLHDLVEYDDYSKKQAAAKLMDGGFDLIACDFNKWYKLQKSFSLKEEEYKESKKDKEWLENFIKTRSSKGKEKKNETSFIVKGENHDDGEGSEKEYECSKEYIEMLDKVVKDILSDKKEEIPYWAKQFGALTSDHSEMKLDKKSLVQAKMWDYLWGGNFKDLAYQLKGANPDGKTRKGLNYNRWVMLDKEHKKNLDKILAQDSYAMIIAGDILVYDLEDAVEDFKNEELQEYKNNDKLKATINLAWEMMHHPGLSDSPDEEDYKPPRGYLYHIAKEFQEFLKDNPSAEPYIKFINANDGIKLGEEEEKILNSILNLEDVEKIYKKLGRENEIKKRFLEIFDKTYDRDMKYCSLYIDLASTVSMVQNPLFRKYINDNDLSEKLCEIVEKTLNRKSKYDPEDKELGTKRLVGALYNNPVLGKYIKGKVNLGEIVNEAIDELIGRREPFITEPLSLRGSHEITMVKEDILETYFIADACREVIDGEKMANLVAYLLGVVTDIRMGSEFSVSSGFMQFKAKREQSEIKGDYMPKKEDEEDKSKIAFLSRIYLREKELRTDMRRASIAVTNALFRANYVDPRRFYPHIDTMLDYLESPIVELLPTEGLGYDAIKEYKILHEFLS